MARSNCITAANITAATTPIGTTVKVSNSYPAGQFRTFNDDTESNTKNKQNKPGVKVSINS